MLNTISNAISNSAQEFYPELSIVSEDKHTWLIEEFLMLSPAEEKNNVIQMPNLEAERLDEDHECLIKEFLMI